MIAAAILARLAAQAGAPPSRLSEAALQELRAYDFPGNVRELENILERAIALSGARARSRPRTCACGRWPRGEESPAAPRRGRTRAARCRRTSTASSAKRSSPRWRRPASTAPRPRSCWASPSARCATACSGSASANRRRMAAEAGWIAGARRVLSPNCDSRPAGSEISLVVLHSISLPRGELRRRRDRAPVHQPPRSRRRIRPSPTSPACACPRIS